MHASQPPGLQPPGALPLVVYQGATTRAADQALGRTQALPLAKAAHQRYQVNRAQARHP